MHRSLAVAFVMTLTGASLFAQSVQPDRKPDINIDINADALKAQIEKMKDFDTGGLTAPLTFSADNHLGNQSVQMVEAKNDQWVKVGTWIES